jgi:hypothetical protein
MVESGSSVGRWMNNVCWCAEIAELVEVMLVEKRARSGWKLMEKFEKSCLGLVANGKLVSIVEVQEVCGMKIEIQSQNS